MDHRPGLWGIISQDAAGTLTMPADVPPIYERIGRSASCGPTTLLTRNISTRSLRSGPPPELPRRSSLQRSLSFLHMEVPEAYTFTYTLFTGQICLQVTILIEADQESDRPNHYTFSLSMKIGPIERALCKPLTMKLSIDPRTLDFVVFAFPPRSSLPVDCLYHLRVWLRTPAGVDHRIFGEQDLWFGKDPDFRTITDASFASLRNATQDMSIYQAIVGRAHVNFIMRWKPVEPEIYTLSLDYEAGGVGKTLFENYHLRLDCEPHTLTFLIYSIPVPSNPPGASHRLRVWIRTPYAASSSSPSPSVPQPHPSAPHGAATAPAGSGSGSGPGLGSPASASYIYQRLWKSDEFKIGAHLKFDSVGSKIILATRDVSVYDPSLDTTANANANTDGGRPPPSWMPLAPNRRRVSRLAPNVGVDDAGETVNDR